MSFGIPILTYHALDDSDAVVSVAPSLFRAQMAHLDDHGYRTLTLAEAVQCFQEEQPVPEKHIVITFDDGYRSVYTEAFPVLQQHGYTSTMFLIPDYCGGCNDWPGQPATIAQRPLMHWSEIQEMHRHGYECAAHTLTHPDLTQLSTAEIKREIVQSKARLQDRLGSAVETFAYPYGRYDTSVRDIARRHFKAACSTQLGRAGPRSDRYVLERMDMYYLKRETLSTILSSSLLDPYLHLRQLLRDLRTTWE